MTCRISDVALIVTTFLVGCSGTGTVDENGGSDDNGRVEIMPGAMALIVDDSFTYAAQYFDDDDMEAEASFTWTSSAPGVAEVANGTVSAVSAGQTEILAEVGTVVSDPVTLTVDGESKSGLFQGSSGKNASGMAVVMQRSGGELRLEFTDDFSVDSGPGLEVFLSNTPGVTAESHNVGALQSISGSQSYQVGGTVDLDSYSHVVIYCVPFSVTFATAALN